MKNNTQNIRDFIRYNNTIPLFLGVIIVITGSAFASTPNGQEAISKTLVGAETKITSIDNTLIASLDFNTWSPKARVTGVKEDMDNYYVDYMFSTIDLVNSKWQYTDKNLSLKVDKNFLKEFKNLESYVAFELKQNIDAENDRLLRTQEFEKKNVTQMQTVTSYSGLAGLVFDENTVVADPVAAAPESLTPGIYVAPPIIPTPIPQPVTEVVQTTETPQVDPIIDTSVITNATTTISTEIINPEPVTEPVPEPVPEPVSEPVLQLESAEVAPESVSIPVTSESI